MYLPYIERNRSAGVLHIPAVIGLAVVSPRVVLLFRSVVVVFAAVSRCAGVRMKF